MKKNLRLSLSLISALILFISTGILAQKTTSGNTIPKAGTSSGVSKSSPSKTIISKPSVSKQAHSPSVAKPSNKGTSSSANSGNRNLDPKPQAAKPQVMVSPNSTHAKPDKNSYGSGVTHSDDTPAPAIESDGGEDSSDIEECQPSESNLVRETTICRKEYRRDWNQRHCGCAGQITFVNLTDDTMNVYLKWVPAERLPAGGIQVLEPIEMSRMIPDFRLLPGDETSILNRCNGGLLYEAVSKARKRKDQWVERGSVRFSCASSVVLLDGMDGY